MRPLGDWCYRLILLAFPAEFRRRHGLAMLEQFREQRGQCGRRRLALAGLWLRAVGDALRHGLALRWERSPLKPGFRPTMRGRWLADIRDAVRLVARRPATTAVSVIGLGIGLTATISVFSIFNSVWAVDPPGVKDRHSLVAVRSIQFRGPSGGAGVRGWSLPEADIALRQMTWLDGVAASGPVQAIVQAGDEVRSASPTAVSGAYFAVLGSRPVIGRLLGPEDDRPHSTAIVIGEAFWRDVFDGRADALGSAVLVGGRRMQVVGVVPRHFARRFSPSLRTEPDTPVFIPLAAVRDWPDSGDADRGWLSIAGRLPAAMDRQTAAQAAAGVARAIEASHGRESGSVSLDLEDYGLGRSGADPSFLIRFAALSLAGPFVLLLIGCANVANLRLAQSTERAPELSVRQALGASRWDLLRLLLFEAIVVAGLALACGWFGTHVLLARLSGVLPIAVTVDGRVAVFAAAIAAAAVLLAGLVPARLAAARTAAQALRQSRQAGGAPHARLRHGLVIVQVALSLVLLTMGALMTRTIQAIYQAQPAAIEEMLTARVILPEADDRHRAASLAQTLAAWVERDPRVTRVGVTEGTEIFGGRGAVRVFLPLDTADTRRHATQFRVTPGWFSAFDLKPLAGRTLTASDEGDVAVVNRSMAATFGPGTAVLGATIRIGGFDPKEAPATVTVVGVVPDSVRQINRPMREEPIVYRPVESLAPAFTVVARTERPDDVGRDLSRAIATLDGRIPWVRVESASAILSREAGPFQFFATAVGTLGVTALVLAASGLFAVMAYLVSLRTREIGVRVALGATTADVAALVLRQVGRLTAVGAATGFLLALPVASVLRFLLVGVSPFDPRALIPVVVILAATALAAGWVPARRAAAVDPVRALRAD